MRAFSPSRSVPVQAKWGFPAMWRRLSLALQPMDTLSWEVDRNPAAWGSALCPLEPAIRGTLG